MSLQSLLNSESKMLNCLWCACTSWPKWSSMRLDTDCFIYGVLICQGAGLSSSLRLLALLLSLLIDVLKWSCCERFDEVACFKLNDSAPPNSLLFSFCGVSVSVEYASKLGFDWRHLGRPLSMSCSLRSRLENSLSGSTSLAFEFEVLCRRARC